MATVGGSEFSLDVETSVDGRSHRVRISGEIDNATVPALREFLRALKGDVEVDCGGVGFVDSAGLAVFVACHRALHDQGGTLRLVNVNDPCYVVFEITGLTELFVVQRREGAD
jgi:anti-anti-sigma factor